MVQGFCITRPMGLRVFESSGVNAIVTAAKEGVWGTRLYHKRRTLMATATTESKSPNAEDELDKHDQIEEVTNQQTDTPSITDELAPREETEGDAAEDATECDVAKDAPQDIATEEVTEDDVAEDLTEGDVAENVTEGDVAEDAIEGDVTEDVTESDAAEDTAEGDVSEDATEDSIAEDVTEGDATEDVTECDVAEDATDDSATEDVTEDGVAEDVAEGDVVGDVTESDATEDVTEDDVAEDATEGDAVEDVTEDGVAADVTESSATEDVAEGDALEEYRDHLSHCLDDELSTLNDTQERIAQRLQAENEPENMEGGEFDALSYAVDISQERDDVLAIVRSLERQIDTSSKFNDILEDEIDSLKKQLSKEKAARTQLEEQLRPLETDINTMAQLREENVSLNKERDELVKLLEEIRPQLDSITEGRDLLSAEVASAKEQAQELTTANVDLEIQGKHLQEKLAVANKKIQQETAARRQTEEVLREVKSRLLSLSSNKSVESSLSSMEADPRTQLMDQTATPTTIHEKYQHEVSKRKRAMEMLMAVQSRLRD